MIYFSITSYVTLFECRTEFMNTSESTQEEKIQHEVYRFTKRKTFLYTKLTCKFYDTSTVGKSYLYLWHLYPGFYSYTEGATWKILVHFTGDPPHLTLNHGFPVIRLSRPKKVA